jgi:hypothetical protein
MVASSNKDVNERYRQVYELRQVVRLLVLPTECYHVSFERYFSEYGDSRIALGQPCLHFCPYCRGEHLNFVSSLRRDVLVDYLDSSVFIDGPCTIGSLAKLLYNKRGSIWIASCKKTTTGNIHALIMQLWTAGILDIRLSAEALKNSENTLKKSDVVCRWSVGPENSTIRMLHRDISRWININIVKEPTTVSTMTI